MIKILLFLLSFSLAHGDTVDYLLPDSHADFSHTLEEALKHARNEILVITPALHHASLKRAALEGVKRGASMTLIVQSLKGDPLSLAQYERVDVRTLGGRTLDGSIIFIDNRFACTLPHSVDAELFSLHASLIQCSDDAIKINALRSALSPLIKRSKSYLE